MEASIRPRPVDIDALDVAIEHSHDNFVSVSRHHLKGVLADLRATRGERDAHSSVLRDIADIAREKKAPEVVSGEIIDVLLAAGFEVFR